MSATIETIITCDGATPKCSGNDWSADSRFLSASQQRANARENGWRHVRGKDYCPECWKELHPNAPGPARSEKEEK